MFKYILLLYIKKFIHLEGNVKVKIIIIGMMFFSILLNSKQLTTFSDLTVPGSLQIVDNRIYIAQGSSALVYDLKTFKLLFKMGKEGQGPGELTKSIFYKPKCSVYDKGVLLEGYNKFIFFNKKGKLLWEKRKRSFVVQTIPIGDKFLVRRGKMDTKPGRLLDCISFYDQNMKPVKDLFTMEHFQQGGTRPGDKITINMLYDTPLISVWEDKIYVEKSSRGFLIDVYNLKGDIIHSIKHPYKNLEFSEERKNRSIEIHKNDPLVKNAGGWKQFKKNIIFPKTYPAIQGLGIYDGKIYVKTYKQIKEKTEYWILDIKGKVLKKVYLPSLKPTNLSNITLTLNYIYENEFYYLEENDDEEWELHCSLII